MKKHQFLYITTFLLLSNIFFAFPKCVKVITGKAFATVSPVIMHFYFATIYVSVQCGTVYSQQMCGIANSPTRRHTDIRKFMNHCHKSFLLCFQVRQFRNLAFCIIVLDEAVCGIAGSETYSLGE